MTIKINSTLIGGSELFFIAGPCVIENERITYRIAEFLKGLSLDKGVPVVFKASYDKANRSSHKSYRGVGLRNGLKILTRIKRTLHIPVISDVHCEDDIKPAAEVLDIIQIPALLCRQTDLLIAAGRSNKPVNIKKGQFLAPEDIIYPVEKIKSAGNNKIIVTERGTTFGYHNLVSDMRSIPIMKSFGFPVVYDATHSVQLPGALKGISGGNRSMIPVLAKAAVASGADGVFFEVHPSPDKALCDGFNSLPIKKLSSLIDTLILIRKAILK